MRRAGRVTIVWLDHGVSLPAADVCLLRASQKAAQSPCRIRRIDRRRSIMTLPLVADAHVRVVDEGLRASCAMSGDKLKRDSGNTRV